MSPRFYILLKAKLKTNNKIGNDNIIVIMQWGMEIQVLN